MKSIFKSSTFWFGIGQIVFGAVGYFTGWLDQSASYALVVTGFGSIGFRLKTSTPVAFSVK